MTKESKSGGGLQEAVEHKVPVESGAFTVAQVRGFVKADLATVRLLIQAMNEDENVLDAIAVFLHGQYLNGKHKEDLAKQGELALKDKV